MIKIFLSLLFFVSTTCFSQDQLLVVTTLGWSSQYGVLQRYENQDDHWVQIGNPIRVVVGEKGLAWGIGLHPETVKTPPFKAEGDKKAPAGMFSIGSAFGFASPKEMSHLKIDYFRLNKYIEAVDDSKSIYYNQIVNRKKIRTPDWNSSEKMSEIPVYKIGLVIHHNFPNSKPGAGSAIFWHIWEGEDIGTSGCTAMSEENLIEVLNWLDQQKNPCLVQLPISTYVEYREVWKLP